MDTGDVYDGVDNGLSACYFASKVVHVAVADRIDGKYTTRLTGILDRVGELLMRGRK
jgi:hypothetical protein